MHTSAHLSPAAIAERGRPAASSLRHRIKAMVARVSEWATARAERLGTAALYAELSRLSDAELRARGLSRATLAHDVGELIADRKGA